MAAKKKENPEESPEPQKAETGTSRVMPDGLKGRVVIPGPILPVPLDGPKPNEKVKEKAKVEKPAPFTVVSTQHIVKTLAAYTDQNRTSRLVTLSRTNRDVAWLLAEFEKLKTQKEKSK